MRPDVLSWINSVTGCSKTSSSGARPSSQAVRWSPTHCAVTGGVAIIIAVGMVFAGAARASENAETSVSGGSQNMTAPAAVFEGIQGKVHTPDGRPLQGVFVQAQPSDPNAGPVPDIAIVTDENGVYRWRLPPGQYTLSVNPENYEAQAAPANVDAGKTTIRDFIVQHQR